MRVLAAGMAAVADPGNPTRLNPVYDSGDHLHPNDTGYHAMANAVNLAMLAGVAPGVLPPGRPCLVQPSFQPIKPGAGLGVTCHPQPAGYTYDDISPPLAYSGAWTHAGSSLSYTYGDYDTTESFSAQVGAGVTVSFTGTGVEWVGPLDTNAGIADVLIDGDLAAQVDTYDLWGKEFQQDVFSARHLRPGPHTLTIVVTGQKNPASSGTGIVVDAIQVTQPS